MSVTANIELFLAAGVLLQESQLGCWVYSQITKKMHIHAFEIVIQGPI